MEFVLAVCKNFRLLFCWHWNVHRMIKSGLVQSYLRSLHLQLLHPCCVRRYIFCCYKIIKGVIVLLRGSAALKRFLFKLPITKLTSGTDKWGLSLPITRVRFTYFFWVHKGVKKNIKPKLFKQNCRFISKIVTKHAVIGPGWLFCEISIRLF
jgi:hypothetical protein